MGSYFSTQFSKADANGDGVISREEFDAFCMRLAQENEERERAQEQRLRLATAQSLDLERQLASLQEVNRQLERKLQQRAGVQDTREDASSFHFSQEHLEQVIETILQDADVNIKYLPDAVERHLYRNVFQILIGVLGQIVRESSMEILGHELRFQLAPKQSAEQNAEESESESEEIANERRSAEHSHKSLHSLRKRFHK